MDEAELFSNVIALRPREVRGQRGKAGRTCVVVAFRGRAGCEHRQDGMLQVSCTAGQSRGARYVPERTPEWMVRALSEPGAVAELAREGCAESVWKFIAGASPEGQARILSGPNAVCALAYRGLADKVWSVVRALDAESQSKVLSAHGAVLGLAYRGKAEELWILVTRLDDLSKRRVVSAPFFDVSMRENGYGAELDALEAELGLGGPKPKRPRPQV